MTGQASTGQAAGDPICVWPLNGAPPEYLDVAADQKGDQADNYLATVPAAYAGAELGRLAFWFADAIPTGLPGGELLYAGQLPARVRASRWRWPSRPHLLTGVAPPICMYFYADAPEDYRTLVPAPDRVESGEPFVATVPAVYLTAGYRPLREFLFDRAADLVRVRLGGGDGALYAGRTVDVRSLFERLGGQTPIRMVVDRFYDRVLADESLAGYFTDVDMPRQRGHLAAFIAAATGGPKPYSGRDLHEAHASLGIADADFDKVVFHLIEALHALGVPQALVAEIAAALAPLKPLIVSDTGLAESA